MYKVHTESYVDDQSKIAVTKLLPTILAEN